MTDTEANAAAQPEPQGDPTHGTDPYNDPRWAQSLQSLGVSPNETQWRQLHQYVDQLLTANKQFNLTAMRHAQQVWDNLIIDSLTVAQGLAVLPEEARIIDVGTGGGIPGIPLAIVLAPRKVTLLDATAKKCRFLQACVDKLALSHVDVVGARAEEAGQQREHRGQYDAAVCKAVGPMPVLLEYTLPLVRVDGFVLAIKGPAVERELDASGDALTLLGAGEVHLYEGYPEGFDRQTLIVRVEKASPTPRAYPRKPGTAKQSPL